MLPGTQPLRPRQRVRAPQFVPPVALFFLAQRQRAQVRSLPSLRSEAYLAVVQRADCSLSAAPAVRPTGAAASSTRPATAHTASAAVRPTTRPAPGRSGAQATARPSKAASRSHPPDLAAVARSIEAVLTSSPAGTAAGATAPLMALLGFTLPSTEEKETDLGFTLLQPPETLPYYSATLPIAQQVYLARRMVNTVLSALGPSPASASTAAQRLPRPAVRAESTIIPVLIDSFKVSLQYLLLRRRREGETRKIDLEGTLYTLIKKLHARDCTSFVLRESAVLYHLLRVGDLSVSIDVPSIAKAVCPPCLDIGDMDEFLHVELLALGVQTSAWAISSALTTPPSEGDLSKILTALQDDATGVRATQEMVRKLIAAHVSSDEDDQKRWENVRLNLDRAVGTIERGAEQALERLSKQGAVRKTSLVALQLRGMLLSLRMLLPTEEKAYWSRVARTAAIWAEGQVAAGDDMEEAYTHAHGMIASLAQLGRETGKLSLDFRAWGQLFELWTLIAKKVSRFTPSAFRRKRN